MMAIKWTDEQRDIIDSRNKNILVSASAGSGKTTVMIQRIIDLVLDEKDRTPISKFLIVTFTKASAADMKQKLIEAFQKNQDDEFCLEQIDNVDTSDISNLHSFCSRLISTYFYEVNVDPSFQVLDGTVSAFLQDRAIQKLFEKKEKLNSLFNRIHKIYPSASASQIIPMILGESKEASLKAQKLQQEGFYVLPINPPTVPVGTSRLRISLSADIEFEEICNIFG